MIQERKRKSVVIDPEDLKAIRKIYKAFRTKIEGEEAIGVNFRVLDKIMKQDTCAPDTLNAIRKFLSNQKTAA